MLDFLHKTPQKSAYIIILLLAFFGAIYNAFLPLHGDEAYYWVWSHHLQTGYYDHPPMIAYFIAVTNFISESEWGVRLVNIFCMATAGLYIFKLAAEMFDKHIALNAVLIFSTIILTHAGQIITTPDSPLTLFWALTLYYSYRAVFKGEKKDYILTGIFLGMMMVSKYTAILFPLFLVLFILLKRRDILTNINFYYAVIISTVIVFPMLFWNYQHDWISFTFQLDNRSTDTFEMHPNLFFEFFGGQFGMFSPVFAAILFFFTLKNRFYFKDDKLFFLSLAVWVVLFFFFYKSLFTRMELNYTAPSYIAGAILTAYIFKVQELKKTFKVGLFIAILLTLVGRYAMLFHLDVVQNRMYANKESVLLLQTHIKEGDAIYGGYLTTASHLRYYLDSHPEADVAIPAKYSQYDMWRKKGYLKDGLVLTKDPHLNTLKARYNSVKQIDELVVNRGVRGERIFYIYRVADAK